MPVRILPILVIQCETGLVKMRATATCGVPLKIMNTKHNQLACRAEVLGRNVSSSSVGAADGKKQNFKIMMIPGTSIYGTDCWCAVSTSPMA